MLTDDQKKAIRAAAAQKRSDETAKQRAREKYEQALTERHYAMTVANREAHFTYQKDKERVPLMTPPEIRKAAIAALAAEGVVNPDEAALHNVPGEGPATTGGAPALPDDVTQTH